MSALMVVRRVLVFCLALGCRCCQGPTSFLSSGFASGRPCVNFMMRLLILINLFIQQTLSILIYKELFFLDHITNEYLFIMQYANGGDLQCYLKNNFKNLTWDDKKKLAFQIADGLNYLHNENILHSHM